MYYRSGTVALTANRWRHTRWAGQWAAGWRCWLCISDRAASGRQGRSQKYDAISKNPTPSIDACLLKEQS